MTLGASLIVLAAPATVQADEGGVPFWLSGQYAALAAVPPSPGWSLPVQLYYYDGTSGMATLPRDGALAAGISSRTQELFLTPTFAPDTKVLGAQLALSLSAGVGGNWTRADLAKPAGGGEVSRSDTVWGLTDLTPTATLGWTSGVHNWMAYLTGNIPAGSYDSNRLANIGIGHAALDAGGGYTYYDAKSGLEVSAVVGFTYNFENYSTNYRNGIDSHLDWSVSQFVSAAWQLGLAGYVYYQLTGDSGSGDMVGPFKSRVAAIGPQANYQFTVSRQQWTAGLRGYMEFWAQNRLEGYAVFATLSIPLGSAHQ